LNLRPRRVTRLSPAQWLANAVEDVRRRVEEWLGVEQKEAVAAKETITGQIGQTESIKHKGIKPAEIVKSPEAAQESPAITETVRQKEDIRRQMRQGISQNKGIRRSGGMGV
jgi:hypothetical protein